MFCNIAPPIDFWYGNCVWGFFGLHSLFFIKPIWINMLWRRKKAKYDVKKKKKKKKQKSDRSN